MRDQIGKTGETIIFRMIPNQKVKGVKDDKMVVNFKVN